MRVCNKCNLLKLDFCFPKRNDREGYYNTCKECKNAYQRQYQKTKAGKEVQVKADQARKEKFSYKRSARSKTFTAIKNGTIQVLPCLICGEKAEAHHHDYSRPLDVMWLCRIHHMEAHSITKGN